MKKSFPYIIGGLVLVLLIVIMTSTVSRPPRRMDERVTLRQTDNIPYGTKVARELLPALFPKARQVFDRQYPGGWDSIDTDEANQAIILVSDYFESDKRELQELAEFVEKGNYVYIISRTASDDVSSFFDLAYSYNYFSYSNDKSDSLKIMLEAPVFTNNNLFTYPGKNYEGFFSSVDTSHTLVLGRNEKGYPNFVRLDKGKGSFFIHTAPLAFSNYFILHKNNVAYYQQALSLLPENISTILWNEYYLEKPRLPNDDKDPNWLRALFSYPAFKWGLLVAAFTLALFVLLGMRRKQRMIPSYERPKNDSLDFVKTLGRLYYDRRDHKNLAEKMAAYFLEHVRSRYKLPTHTLDDVFVQALHFKSGYPETETRNIINTIHSIKLSDAISEMQLAEFHRQLELFYQNT